MNPAFIKAIALLTIVIFAAIGCSNDDSATQTTKRASTTTTTTLAPTQPQLETQVVLDGLNKPWDIAFIDEQTFLFTQKQGTLHIVKSGAASVLAKIDDVRNAGEGGLLGLAIDSNFQSNRFVYLCFNSSSAGDVRVAQFTLNKELSSLDNRKVIVSGIDAKSTGRHSGCRVSSDSNGHLFIGTGDAAKATNPQDPKSLAGKILRVDRNGNGVKGNLGEPFDSRIFNYGHRNVQGLALFEKAKDGVFGFSVEHGSDRDDEINLIKPGNFGWSPTGTYNEGVPMTDKARFPDAHEAIWSSGNPTIAPSGATLITGKNWGTFNGALAMAVLKDKKIKIIKFNGDYAIEFDIDAIDGFGRIRSVTQSPDGNLYFTTDESPQGKIVKVTPTLTND